MTHILYINDNNLRLQHLGSESGHGNAIRSKGYVWFKGDQVIFDTDKENEPIKFCRLSPQEINNRYWQQCEKSSISSNAAGMRHAADLIWKHLGELKKAHSIKDLIFVVPSHYRSSNLELLLGIAGSLGINVKAILNGAMLSVVDELNSKNETSDAQYRHLDVQLHQTVVSTVLVESGVARLGEIEIIQGVGIQIMQDALLKTLQTHFIQNDRFDPLHNAETEQQLFDNLSKIVTKVNQSSKTLVSVSYQGQLYSTSIDAKVVNAPLLKFVDELIASSAFADHIYVQLNTAFDESSLPNLVTQKMSLLNNDVVTGFSILDITKGADPDIAKGTDPDITKGADGSLQYLTQLDLAPVIGKSVEVHTSGNQVKAKITKGVPQANANTLTRKPLTGATHLLQAGIAVAIEYAELRVENQQLILDALPKADGNAQSLLESGELIVLRDESCREFRANDRIGSHLADGIVTVIKVV